MKTKLLNDALSSALRKPVEELFHVEHASLARPADLLVALRKARATPGRYPLVVLHEPEVTIESASHLVVLPFSTFERILRNVQGRGDSEQPAPLARYACCATAAVFYVALSDSPSCCPFCGSDDCFEREQDTDQ